MHRLACIGSLLLAFGSGLIAPLLAESSGQSTTRGMRLEDLDWLAGDWVGGDESEYIEETWSPPRQGNMIGMFRMLVDGRPRFYEFMSIEPGSSAPVLRIKHFDPGLIGWEDKTESIVFVLLELAPDHAVFETTIEGNPERLIFEREDNRLEIVLEKPAAGSRTSFAFHLRAP